MATTNTIDLWGEPETIDIGKGLTMTRRSFAIQTTRVVMTAEHDDFKVPLHYHETHDEIFRAVEGRVQYTLGEPGAKFRAWSRLRATTRFYTPEDGEIIIPRGTAHAVFVEAGDKVIVEEKTTPMMKARKYFSETSSPLVEARPIRLLVCKCSTTVMVILAFVSLRKGS